MLIVEVERQVMSGKRIVVVHICNCSGPTTPAQCILSEVLYGDKESGDAHVFCPPSSWLYGQLSQIQGSVHSLESGWRSYWHFFKFLKSSRAQLIHIYSFENLLIAALARVRGVKVVLTLLGRWRDYRSVRHTFGVALLANQLIAGNLKMFRSFNRRLSSRYKRRELIRPGIDLQRSKSEPLASLCDKTASFPAHFVVALISFHPLHALNLLLQAMDGLEGNGMQVLLIVPPHCQEVIPERIGQLDRVRIVVYQDECIDLLQEADALYISSGKPQAFIHIALAAMAMGKPVMALSEGDFDGVLFKGSTGYPLFDESVAEITRALSYLQSQPCLSRTRYTHYLLACDYSIARMMTQLETIYQQMAYDRL